MYADPEQKNDDLGVVRVKRWIEDGLGLEIARDFEDWQRLVWADIHFARVPWKLSHDLDRAVEEDLVDQIAGYRNSRPTRALMHIDDHRKSLVGELEGRVFEHGHIGVRAGSSIAWHGANFLGTHHPNPHVLSYSGDIGEVGTPWDFEILPIIQNDALYSSLAGKIKGFGSLNTIQSFESALGDDEKIEESPHKDFVNEWKRFMYKVSKDEKAPHSFASLNRQLQSRCFLYTLEGKRNPNDNRRNQVESPPREYVEHGLPAQYFSKPVGLPTYLSAYYTLCTLGYSRYAPHLPMGCLKKLKTKKARSFQEAFGFYNSAAGNTRVSPEDQPSWDYLVDMATPQSKVCDDSDIGYDAYSRKFIGVLPLSVVISPNSRWTQAIYGFLRYVYYEACLRVASGKIVGDMIPDIVPGDEFLSSQHAFSWLLANDIITPNLEADNVYMLEWLLQYFDAALKEPKLSHLHPAIQQYSEDIAKATREEHLMESSTEDDDSSSVDHNILTRRGGRQVSVAADIGDDEADEKRPEPIPAEPLPAKKSNNTTILGMLAIGVLLFGLAWAVSKKDD